MVQIPVGENKFPLSFWSCDLTIADLNNLIAKHKINWTKKVVETLYVEVEVPVAKEYTFFHLALHPRSFCHNILAVQYVFWCSSVTPRFCLVVSIGLFWLYFMPFSYNGLCFFSCSTGDSQIKPVLALSNSSCTRVA